MIGAYYYAWYSDDWLQKTVRKEDPPLMGQYENTVSSDVIQQHMKLAKDSGIDFFSVSWEPNRDYSHVLDAAKATDFKICFFYESLTRASAKGKVLFSDLPNVLADMGRIYEDMQEDCWFKLDDKPVMMFYVTRCYSDKDGAPEMFRMIRETLPGAFIVGDELFWRSVPEHRLKMFDAVTAYNLYCTKQFQGDSPEVRSESYLRNFGAMMKTHKNACLDAGIQLWGNAMPGYDDTGVRPGEKHPSLSRLDGDFLTNQLRAAKETSIGEVIMITSWNEWYEDTQIEPSLNEDLLEIVREYSGTK